MSHLKDNDHFALSSRPEVHFPLILAERPQLQLKRRAVHQVSGRYRVALLFLFLNQHQKVFEVIDDVWLRSGQVAHQA